MSEEWDDLDMALSDMAESADLCEARCDLRSEVGLDAVLRNGFKLNFKNLWNEVVNLSINPYKSIFKE